MTNRLPLTAPSCSDDHDPEALHVETAQQRIIAAITPLSDTEAEYLPLRESLDRVLADTVVASMDVPPSPNSAMDGYGLLGTDLPVQGSRELRVIGSSYAGHPFPGRVTAGECVRIMTGAVIPAGVDTVVAQEHVQLLEAERICIDGRSKTGDNVRRAGEDISQGQTLLAAGHRIGTADLGLLASVGMTEVRVQRRLRVAFFSTGDELRGVGESLAPGQIYDSNRYTLYGMLMRQHCQISDLGSVPDDPAALRSTLLAAAPHHDLIIATGGVSVGDADHVRRVFAELGELNFWKVAMKPGRPLTFGRLQQAWFFGLPGNPVAVMVSFCQFVLPALQQLAGTATTPPLTVKATSTSVLKKRPGRTEYQRGILSYDSAGNLLVSKTGEQGSGILSSMSKANCFIVLSIEQTRIEPGQIVTVQPFAGLL
ncbi:molybdopterin molybdotransferase MoeA [Methylomonas paludis]|uniref:Molybdopterin molybdenumtransferase n=1 Tax=Methylomonas paludis TaxID=1173101 RepID=A0A975MMF1_9GAMM|nr:gephyrin-like molybdotransferase Glp [Methylomonas paludis]QWF70553.1 molybdopterin molybdotransferase MoeA [Methylomonas paludis]